MAKPAKEAPVEAEVPVKPKSKRLLLAVIALLVLGAVGGGVWYFLKGTLHSEEAKPVVEQPVFVVLEPFTVNLQHDEGDQYLNIGITLKIANVEVGDKVKQHLPELRSRLLFLLSSKHPSELMPVEGKKKLAQEIIVEANSILGVRTASPQGEAASAVEAEPVAHGNANGKGVLDVLFTAFIIQ